MRYFSPMNVLLCAATPPELGHLLPSSSSVSMGQLYEAETSTSHHLQILCTGVGMTATAYQLGKIFAAHSFDLAVNIGLGGSLDADLHLGTAVEVVSEEWGDTGAENHDHFMSLAELGLWPANQFPFVDGLLHASRPDAWASSLPRLAGTTVNTVHGNAGHIEAFKRRSAAQVETMEGGAFFFACLMAGVPSLQIRAISNYVEPRNRENWQIREALDALHMAFGHWWQGFSAGSLS